MSRMYACVWIHTYIHTHIRVCAHAFFVSALCPLKLVRRVSWQAIGRVYVQLPLCMASLFHLHLLQAGGEMGYSARQGRWPVPSSAGAGFYSWFLIHEIFFPFLALECQRELGCFEGEVPAESLVTRQPWAITINWNHFHLPYKCNDSQLVSWFKLCGFPLSPFLPSAFPTRSSCPGLSQSLSGLALCLLEKVPAYCAALWKVVTLLRALPLRLWLQHGCCGVAYNLPGGRQDSGCLLSPHPFRAKRGVWAWIITLPYVCPASEGSPVLKLLLLFCSAHLKRNLEIT